MKKVVEYTQLRGIRVVAEFDIPGEVPLCDESKGTAGLGLVSQISCQNATIRKGRRTSSRASSTSLSRKTLTSSETSSRWTGGTTRNAQEALEIFPDNHMHFGGDEVSSYMLECWQKNKEVTA